MKRAIGWTIMLSLALWWAAAQAADDVLLQAMRAELQRSQERLALPDYPKPYFIAYRVTELDIFTAGAELGAILYKNENKWRQLYGEVRVGDYQMDNSSSQSSRGSWGPDMDTIKYLDYNDLPIEDDLDAIRVKIWRLTDLKFKNALADYLAKKAAAVYRENPDAELADFSQETPVRHLDPPLRVKLDREYWLETLRQASLVLKEYPQPLDSFAALNSTIDTHYFLSTEGAELVQRHFYFEFSIKAETLAEDGLTVAHYYSFQARSVDGLPDRAAVLAGVRQMADELMALREAPVIEPYTGPAILDPTMAAVYFHEAIGHRLEGHRLRSSDEGKTFKDKIGQAILPDFLDVIDDPTLTHYGGKELFGHYLYDEEGVPARRVELVRNGVLQTFLLSRKPIAGFSRSNGHGRADWTSEPTSRMGVTLVVPRRTMPLPELKEQLLRLAREQGKPYGLWLRAGKGGLTTTGGYKFQAFTNQPILLYRIDARTGEEQLVRGAEVVGTPLLSLTKVVAAGDDVGVFNGYCGAESGEVPVSAAAPSLLIGELELQRVEDKPTKPPLLPPPYRNRKGK